MMNVFVVQCPCPSLFKIHGSIWRCPFFKAFPVTVDVPEIYMQEFWATESVHHLAIRFKMDNKKHILDLESFRDILHICPRVHGQPFAEPSFEEEILAFIRFLGHSAVIKTLTDKKSNEMYYPRFTKAIIHHFMSKDPSIPRRNKFGALLPIELTNDKIRKSKAYKEYYAIAIGEAAPKPKANVRRTRTKASKAKSLYALSEVAMIEAQQLKLVTKRSKQQMHISQPSGSGADEGSGSKPGVPAVPTDESEEELSWNSTDDEGDDNEEKDDDGDEEDEGDDSEEGNGDDDDEDDNGKEEESFDPIPQTPKSSEDEGDGEEDQGLNIGEEERHVEEEEEDELYRDVNINQGRGLQASLEVEDSHVTLTPVNLDGKQINLLEQENVEFLKTVDENIKKIIKEQVKEQVKAQVSKILPRIEQAMNEQLEAEVLTRSSQSSRTSYAVAVDLSKMELKKILIEKMEGNKSIQRSDEQRNLYKALDEEPSAGPDQGSKRRREGKEPESASAPIETATRSTARSSQGSRSRHASASESALAEEPMQTTSQMEEPTRPEFDAGADDQSIVQSSQHPEWFPPQQKPPTSDRDWNKTLLAVHESIQPWISELAKQADSRSSFNELMDTPLDFFNFLMNRLRVDTLTPELLAGPTYNLVKGSCKSLIEPEYHLEEVYKATTDQLDWVNPEGASSRKYTTSITKMKALDYEQIKWIEDLVPRTMWINEPIGYDKHALWGVSHWGRKRQQFYGFTINRESARDVYSKRRIIAVTKLKIVEWHSYKHLDWITMRRDDDKLYKFKEDDFKRLRIQNIKDMLLLLIQGKLTNLTRRVEDLQLRVKSYQKKLNLTNLDSYRSDLKHKEAYTAYSNPRGFIYQNKDKKNRLMRIDELHKFSDGTFTDVRTALDDRLKGIQMWYLPQTIWRKSDKDRAVAMIQAIEKRMKTKRIMRSLERFIGGRLYEGDFRMLQRTI
nr:hypothetical protein [Tanacetum cinerariifolium]